MSERVFMDGDAIDLRAADFVAAGGQGRVYARGELAFKVFDDPAHLPSRAKLAELKAIAGPHVAAPLGELTDTAGACVGYHMPFFRGAHSWAQLCTPAFRRRAGIDGEAALGLVRSLGAALAEIHRHGTLVVDLSENNVLVRGPQVCLIDLDSWQTPRHPATALTPSIESPHAPKGHFDERTDWFAFAVLASTLLLGIHPFKGKHPRVKGLRARMQAHLSVFDPAVRLPSVCADPRTIPVALCRWLRGALERGEAGPPPLGPLPSPTPAARFFAGGRRYPEAIRWVLVEPGEVVVATRTAAFCNDAVWLDPGRALRALGRTPCGRPFVLRDGAGGGLELCVRGADPVALELRPDALICSDGAVFARCRARLVRLEVRMVGARAMLLTRAVAQVLPHATQLFPGVALQNMLGRWRASLLGHPRGTPQISLPQLGPAEVLDARRAGDRLVVLAEHAGVISGHVWALGPDGRAREHACAADVEPWGTTFVQYGGVCVEVGKNGVRPVGDDASAPWTPLPGSPHGVELHTDGRRLLASWDRTLHEVHLHGARAGALGFDATRCR